MSEIHETYHLLTEIDRLLADIELKINRIEGKSPEIERTLVTFTKLERIALRWVALSNRIAGSEDATQVFRALTRILMVMQMLYASGQLLFSGPVGVIYAIPALAMSQMTIMEGY